MLLSLSSCWCMRWRHYTVLGRVVFSSNSEGGVVVFLFVFFTVKVSAFSSRRCQQSLLWYVSLLQVWFHQKVLVEPFHITFSPRRNWLVFPWKKPRQSQRLSKHGWAISLKIVSNLFVCSDTGEGNVALNTKSHFQTFHKSYYSSLCIVLAQASTHLVIVWFL